MKSLQKSREPLSVRTLLMACLIFMGVLNSNLSMAQSNEDSWQLLKESDGVEVYFLLNNCAGNEFMHLRVENKSNSKVNFSWTAERLNLSSDNKVVDAGAVVSGDCDTVSTGLSVQLSPDFSFHELVLNISKID